MRLPVTRWGNGPTPLLLLHGFTGSAQSFSHLENTLSPYVRVTAPHLPGHAGAPGVASWDEALEEVGALLSDDTGWCVAGYSQGARLALALAARQPRGLKTLVLESGSPGLRTAQERASRRESDAQWSELLRMRGLEPFYAAWDAQPLFGTLTSAHAPMRQAARHQHAATGLASALDSMGTGQMPPLWDALNTINIPSLLITGDLDPRYTAINVDMQRLLPGARHVMVNHAGHVPHLEQAAQYANTIIHFLHHTLQPQGSQHGVQLEEGPRL